jgi:hypothetical protein
MLKWFNKTIQKIGFEDVKYAIQNNINHIIINTLPITEQQCLILNTIPIHIEEKLINEILNSYEPIQKKIIIYGKNTCDSTVDVKYKQLEDLGFKDIYVYSGGLFEWLLLQDIYGKDEFPSTSRELDILKYKPVKIFTIQMLTY